MYMKKYLVLGLLVFIPFLAKADTSVFGFMNGNFYDVNGSPLAICFMDNNCLKSDGTTISLSAFLGLSTSTPQTITVTTGSPTPPPQPQVVYVPVPQTSTPQVSSPIVAGGGATSTPTQITQYGTQQSIPLAPSCLSEFADYPPIDSLVMEFSNSGDNIGTYNITVTLNGLDSADINNLIVGQCGESGLLGQQVGNSITKIGLINGMVKLMVYAKFNPSAIGKTYSVVFSTPQVIDYTNHQTIDTSMFPITGQTLTVSN